MKCGKGDLELAEILESLSWLLAFRLIIHQKNSLEAAVSSKQASPTSEGLMADLAEMNHFAELTETASVLLSVRMARSTVDSAPKIK